ncbi:MAG: CvpA family protein [bacterium]
MVIQPWWTDAALVIIAILYSIDGIRRGFLLVLTEVVGFLISLLLAFVGYVQVAKIILKFKEIPISFANAIAFFAIWICIGLLYPFFARIIYRKIPDDIKNHKLNKWSGFLPALLDALVLFMVVLPLLVTLPLSGSVKQAVLRSNLGAPIARFSDRIDRSINNIFSPAVKDSLAFLTIHPKSDESVSLRFSSTNHSVDEESESTMFEHVNSERIARGIKPLVYDTKLRDLARKYGETMVEQGFFSHNGKDGSTPGTRAGNMKIEYRVLGENLAFAPDVEYAYDGLMNSEGHRANILSKDYGKLGVGVIDAGIYGKMFVQEFSD